MTIHTEYATYPTILDIPISNIREELALTIKAAIQEDESHPISSSELQTILATTRVFQISPSTTVWVKHSFKNVETIKCKLCNENLTTERSFTIFDEAQKTATLISDFTFHAMGHGGMATRKQLSPLLREDEGYYNTFELGTTASFDVVATDQQKPISVLYRNQRLIHRYIDS